MPVTSASWESRGLFVDDWTHVELSDASSFQLSATSAANDSRRASFLKYGPHVFPAAIALEYDAITVVMRGFRELTPRLPTSSEPLEVRCRLLLQHVVDVKVISGVSRSTPIYLQSKDLVAAELVVIYYSAINAVKSTLSIYSSTPRFSHALRCLQKQSLMSRCLGLLLDSESDSVPDSLSTDPSSVAKEYYDEILLSLKCAPSRLDIVNTLEEFATECKTSLELKRIALRDKNLLYAVHDICKNCLFLSTPRNDLELVSGPWTSCLDQISAEWLEVGAPDDVREAASRELGERVFVYRAALNALICVLFGTDAIMIRQRIVEGPKPLTITCWVELLMHDVYTMATHRLGFREPKLSTDAMVEELDHTLRSSIDSSLSMSLSLPQRNSNRLDRLSLSDTLRSSSSGATLTSRSLLSTSSRLVNRLRHQMFFQAEQSVEIIQVSVSGSGDYDGLAPRYITPESRGALPVIRSGPNRARGARVVRFDTTRGSPAMIDTVGSAFLSCPSSTSTIEVKTETIEVHRQHRSKTLSLRERSSVSNYSLALPSNATKIGDRRPQNIDTSFESPQSSPRGEAGSEATGLPISPTTAARAAVYPSLAPWQGYLPVPASPAPKRSGPGTSTSPVGKEGLDKADNRTAVKKILDSSRIRQKDIVINATNDDTKISVSGNIEWAELNPSSDRWVCFLETKEIMIFFCVDVLRSLVYDSVEVAHRIHNDHGEEVVAARSAMRYLFPLASGQMNVENLAESALTAQPPTANKSSGVGTEPSSAQSTRPQAAKDAENKSRSPAVTPSESPRRSFWGLKFIGALQDSHGSLQDAPSHKDGRIDQSALLRGTSSTASESVAPNCDNNSAQLESDTITKAPFERDVLEFGAPRYGLSPSAWTLLLRSYLGIEDLAMNR